MTTIKLILKKKPNFYTLKKINNIYITLVNYGTHIYSNKHQINTLKLFFSHTFVNYFTKIIWRGKAYRVRFFKTSSKFTLNFGHSHWLKIIFKKNYFNFFKIRRQSYLILFAKRLDSSFLKNIFNKMRVYNRYTRRGIRLKKTPYIRRFGKISQVNSILHSF